MLVSHLSFCTPYLRLLSGRDGWLVELHAGQVREWLLAATLPKDPKDHQLAVLATPVTLLVVR